MATYLILRAKNDALRVAESLQNQGQKVIIEPMFFVTKLAVNIGNLNPQALIITSANACDAIIHSNFAHNIKIFAIGPQSAKRLIAEGYKNILYAPKKSAKSLKNLIAQRASPQNGALLYFRGDCITLDFKLELEPKGFEIHQFFAYKINWQEKFSTQFLQQAYKEKIDFVLLYSQNSVKKFYELAKNNNMLEYFSNSKLLCLSSKIAATAKKLGFKNLGYINKDI